MKETRREKSKFEQRDKAELETTALDLSKGEIELEVHEVHEMEGSAHQPAEMDIVPREVDTVRGVEVEAPRSL
jgi:hypothetical protein